MEPSRILLITPSLGIGGMQRVLTLLANDFVARGAEVSLFSLKGDAKSFYLLDNRIALMSYSSKYKKRGIRGRFFDNLTKIRWAIKHSQADKILVFGKYQSALTLLASVGLHKELFLSDRASPLHRDPCHMDLFSRLVFRVFPPAGVIAQTKISAEVQVQRFARSVPMVVIPNPVKPLKHYELPKKRQVLAVGRLGDPLKGLDLLLDAWERVNASDWQLVIAGGTPSEDQLIEQRMASLKRADSVTFLGKVSDIDKIYAESSLFVIPSRSEGFPNALLEALCMGLPSIAFDFVAGPRDLIVSGENGLIVKNGDIQELASAIEFMINNPQEAARMGCNAREMRKQFTVNEIAGRYYNFIIYGKGV